MAKALEVWVVYLCLKFLAHTFVLREPAKLAWTKAVLAF
jgi:hypothetical protein